MMKPIVLSIAVATLSLTRSQAINVPTQKLDNSRSGATLNETVLTLSNVNTNAFGKLFERGVDNQLYAQPLIVEGLNVGGRTRNVVFLVTVANTAYAYDADDPTASAALWTTSFGNPVPQGDVQCCCTDISDVIGTVGTPAIDVNSRTIYFVTKQKDSDSTYHVRLRVLDLLSGAQKAGSGIDITTSGFDPKIEGQRAGLLLQGGRIYVAFASHNDCGGYHGYVFAYDTATMTQVAVFNDTPTGTKGGIWMSGGGLVGDGNNLYFTTGNGDFNANNGGSNYGECFVGLNGSLTVLTWFAPKAFNQLNGHDLDLGGAGVSFVTGTRLLVSGGKDGKVYLVNADNMGGYNSGSDACVQSFATGAGHLHGGPVSWLGSAGLLTYIWPEGGKLTAYQMVGGLYNTTPAWQSAMSAPNGMPGGQLWISANGAANGIVWVTVPWSGDANHSTVPGVLRAFNAAMGVELYNSHQLVSRDDFGNFAKNPSPVVSNGKVYVPTFSGKLAVYGLIDTNNPPPPPPPPGNGDGLTGNYFNNKTLSPPAALTRIDPTINFNWGQNSPAPSVSRNSFSVRWTGFVQPQFSETYTFYTKTDDGVRLWVNGVLLIDHWVDQSATEWSGSISLTAGTKYSITMEYYDNTGAASAMLSWSSTSTPKAIIPQSQLYSQ